MHGQQHIKKNQYTLRTISAFLLQIFSQYTQQKMFKTHATNELILLCVLSINPKALKITNQNAVFMVYTDTVTFIKSNTFLAQMEHLSGYDVYFFMHFTSGHVE